MPDYAIVRTEKLRTTGNIGGSGQHAQRERNTPNADPERSPTNQTLRGPTTARAIVDAVKQRLKIATHQHPDPVLCLEYLFAYTPGAPVNPGRYFQDCLAWLDSKHKPENVVSAIVHNDETSPHMCAYVVPLDHRAPKVRTRNVSDGRNPDGSHRRKVITQSVGEEIWLSAATFVGSRKMLSDMQSDFARRVGRPHGLVRGVEGSRASHTSILSRPFIRC